MNCMRDTNRSTAEKKARLISEGRIYVPPQIHLPFPLSRSTAGPGTGHPAIGLAFENARIKLSIGREPSRLSLIQSGTGYRVLENGHTFIENVKILNIPAHAPEQCFVNIHSRCIFNCAFCNSPRIKEAPRSNRQIANFIISTIGRNNFNAVAITSAIPETVEKQIEDIFYIVQKIKTAVPQSVVGVEPYVENRQQIQRLKDAGASEIKINIQSYDSRILERACPEFDRNKTMALIAEAAQIFGRGKVTSNIIFGLGESDESVLGGVEALAKLGCIPTLRALQVNSLNRKPLENAGFEPKNPEPERILRLAEAHKKILERYGLTTKSFRTMCHACRCCDIVPFYDI